MSSTLGAAIREHVRAKCKTQKYWKFKSAKCQKVSQHCSISGQYLAWPLYTSCLTTVLPALQKARKKKKIPTLHVHFPSSGTSMRDSCPWTGYLCITLCVWTQALCWGKQPLGTRETLGRRIWGAPCRGDAGMQGQGSSRAGFLHPARISHFSLHPGAAH